MYCIGKKFYIFISIQNLFNIILKEFFTIFILIIIIFILIILF